MSSIACFVVDMKLVDRIPLLSSAISILCKIVSRIFNFYTVNSGKPF